MTVQIGVIGGSGLYDMAELTDREEKTLTTPFGDPSGPYLTGTLRGKRVDAVFAVDRLVTFAIGVATLDLIGSPYISLLPNLDVAQFVASYELIGLNPETIKRFFAALKLGIALFFGSARFRTIAGGTLGLMIVAAAVPLILRWR